jgi:hypothetical protein
MESGPLKNRVDPPNTRDGPQADGETVADRQGGLGVVGSDLSTDGLEQIAILLLKLGRANEPTCGDRSDRQ